MSVDNYLKEKIENLKIEYLRLVNHHWNVLDDMFVSEIPEMVYNSNAIENSTLTLQETESILFFDKIKKDHEVREIYEAKNLAKVIAFLQKNKKQKFSIELILKLHHILLNGINDHFAGRFRFGDERVRIGSHMGANPYFVNSLMYELVKKYNKD